MVGLMSVYDTTPICISTMRNGDNLHINKPCLHSILPAGFPTVEDLLRWTNQKVHLCLHHLLSATINEKLL